MTKFHYITINGSHADLGRAIGETFRDKIRETIAWRRHTIPDYKELLKRSQHYFLATLHLFPKLIEELTAMAVASDVGVMDLFFMNTRSLYDPTPDPEEEKLVSHDRCTTVVSFGGDGAIIGHNEDWEAQNIDELYILKATIGDTTFLGVSYATELPGTAAAINNWGLVQAINEVHQIDLVGVPKNFFARAVLECQTLDAAEQLLSQEKQDSGFNHVLVQGNTVRNVEIAAAQIDVLEVTNQTFVHTNHFLGHLKKYEIYQTKSSKFRYQRAQELARPNMTVNEMKGLLSDHESPDYPICRHQETIASLIFLPQKGEVHIAAGPPCQENFVKYTL
ncbi:MAG: C45 family autoproteolytic acyltransferase/hydrolase [Patescibacteria group bacterium]